MKGMKYGIGVATDILGCELGYMEKNGNMSWVLNVVVLCVLNTIWTGDADLRFYVTTVQDG